MKKRYAGTKTTTRDYKDMVKVGKSFTIICWDTKTPITSVQEKTREIELYLFGDANIIGTSAVAALSLNKPHQKFKRLPQASHDYKITHLYAG